MAWNRNSKVDFMEFLKIFFLTAVQSAIYTAIWIPVYITRTILVRVVKIAKPSYGRILDHGDSSVEENYTEEPPKNSIIFNIILDGPLELKDLRTLFIKNVLAAKVRSPKSGRQKLKYPELKQYQVDLAGYRFWKDDGTFNVDNHIAEVPYSNKFASIVKIHQTLTNTLFPKKRSPWEIILVRNYKNNPQKTLLVWRSHHTLGDTKSLLKLLVGSLGKKELTLPKAKYAPETLLNKVVFFALFPFYFVFIQVLGYYAALRADDSPFKFRQEKEPLLNIGLSKKISMNDIKLIAKRNNVTTSAVIMAAIAGGVAKSNPRLGRKEIPCQWVLPKPDHPDHKLANYSYIGTMDLPTTIAFPRERLQKCSDIFQHLKTSHIPKYAGYILFQLGTWFNPLRSKFLKSSVYPLCLTNIASDVEGFQIGGKNVEEFTMTCAPVPGVCGVIICAFSYKDTLEISATAKDGVLSEKEVQRMCDLVAKEIEVLKNA